MTRTIIRGRILRYKPAPGAWAISSSSEDMCIVYSAGGGDSQTNDPNVPRRSPMKQTPIDSSLSAVGNLNAFARARTSVDF